MKLGRVIVEYDPCSLVARGVRLTLLCLVGLSVACSGKPPPPPAPPQPAPTPTSADATVAADARQASSAVDPQPAVAVLAIDAPASPLASLPAPLFGVQWRAAIPGVAESDDGTEAPSILHDKIVVSHGDALTVFDRATGKLRGRVDLPHTRLVADHDTLVATTDTEEFGIDPQKLVPTWHAPAPNSLFALGDWLVETPVRPKRPGLRLRRASDGEVLWEIDERSDPSTAARRFVVGDALYLQQPQRVAAIDLPTGTLRWHKPGSLRSASGAHIAIADSPGHLSIVDADGHERWSARCKTILLHGNTAYAMTDTALTAVDLATNTVRWRYPDAVAFASDDTWVYAWTPIAEATTPTRLVILAADTGKLAAQLPLPRGSEPTISDGRATVVLGGKWVLALGPLTQPEPLHATDARVCLVVRGCQLNTAPLASAAVVLGGIAATTDRRGCFRFRAAISLAPLDLAVTGGTMAGQPASFDTPFPDTVVLDGPALTLHASYLGAGCHDARPGAFP